MQFFDTLGLLSYFGFNRQFPLIFHLMEENKKGLMIGAVFSDHMIFGFCNYFGRYIKFITTYVFKLHATLIRKSSLKKEIQLYIRMCWSSLIYICKLYTAIVHRKTLPSSFKCFPFLTTFEENNDTYEYINNTFIHLLIDFYNNRQIPYRLIVNNNIIWMKEWDWNNNARHL